SQLPGQDAVAENGRAEEPSDQEAGSGQLDAVERDGLDWRDQEADAEERADDAVDRQENADFHGVTLRRESLGLRPRECQRPAAPGRVAARAPAARIT